MRKKQPSEYVMVGTKLQAAIVKEMIDQGFIHPPFHLVKLYSRDFYSSGRGLEYYCEKLIPFSGDVKCIAKSKRGFIRTFLFFIVLQIKCRLFKERLYISNIDWYPFAVALKLVPGLSIYTFDDGAANVQERENSYLSELGSRERGFRAALARLIFPKGPSYFVRTRIQRHYTIYPGLPNIVADAKIHVLNLQWAKLIDNEDVELLPRNVRRIFLGTVYEEAKRTLPHPISEYDIRYAIRWADLHIPHPRDPASNCLPIVLRKYTAETILGYYSKFNEIEVAHFNSSAIIPFWNNPRVVLIDLCHEPVRRIMSEDSQPEEPT